MRSEANPYPPGSDEFFIRECFELAHAGMGFASPNPPVGSVIVRAGAVIGRGAHLAYGGPHAELNALAATQDAADATCYTSLEPCSHIGLQPSCCHALIEAGIRRVVFSSSDSDPRSAGRARELLEAAGLEVSDGVLADEGNELLDGYAHFKRTSRLFVHFKAALSLDGKMACFNGASQWLSGAESLGLAHYLRQKHDAVLIGPRTALHDDPRLTVRPEVLAMYRAPQSFNALRDPVRVLLDPSFSIVREIAAGGRAQSLKLLEPGSMRDGLPRIVIAGAATDAPGSAALARLESQGVVLVGLQQRHCAGGLDFRELFEALAGMGLTSLLVEGGPGLAAVLLAQKAADKATLVYTPKLIGLDGLGFTPVLGLEVVKGGPFLSAPRSGQLGADTFISGLLQWS